MNKNFVERFARFLKRKINESMLNKQIEIIDISVNEFNIKTGKFFSLSSNKKMNDYIRDYNNVFSANGSHTIKKTNGYYMQSSINPNCSIGEEKFKSKNLFIKTDLTQESFIEIIIASTKIISNPHQKALATILFKDILNDFYKETRSIKSMNIEGIEKYQERYNLDFKEEFMENKPEIDINFNWQIDHERSLNTKQLQLILSLMLSYDNEEIKRYFGISKESKAQYFEKIKNTFKLEKKSKKSEILRVAKKLNIVQSLEKAMI